MKVLVVDDEPDFLEQAELFLEKENENLEVITANSGKKGLELIKNDDFDCVVSDYKMPEMNGLELLETIRNEEMDLPFIMRTGRGDEKVEMHSANLGVEHYLMKKGDPKKLFENLKKAIKQVSKERVGGEHVVAWIGKEAPLKRFATDTLVGVDKDKSVQEATRRMVDLGVDSLVVLDDSEIVVFFTDGDVRRKVTAQGRNLDSPIEEIMETDLDTINISESVSSAIDLMSKRDVKHLLTEENGKINGILTLGDIIGIGSRQLETYISRE